MNKALRNKQAAYLLDTILHYNSANRGQTSKGACQYQPQDNSEGCAIGRKIKSKVLCKKFDNKVYNPTTTTIRALFDYTPKNIQSLGVNFLASVQDLHDTSFYWNESGLSANGLIQVKNIFSQFKLSF